MKYGKIQKVSSGVYIYKFDNGGHVTIIYDPTPIPSFSNGLRLDWKYSEDSYDGPEDMHSIHGQASSLEECVDNIDEDLDDRFYQEPTHMESLPSQIASLISEDPNKVRRRGWQHEKQLIAEELEDPSLGDFMYTVKFTVGANFTKEEPMVRYYPDGSGYPGAPAEVEWEILSIDSIEAVDLDGRDVDVNQENLREKIKNVLLSHISDDTIYDEFREEHSDYEDYHE